MSIIKIIVLKINGRKQEEEVKETEEQKSEENEIDDK